LSLLKINSQETPEKVLISSWMRYIG